MTAAIVTLSIALAAASASATLLVPRAAPWPVPTPQQIQYGGSMSALVHFNMCVNNIDGSFFTITL